MDPHVRAALTRHLRERLLDDAHLFPDEASYRAGVDDALEGLLAALDAAERRPDRHRRAGRLDDLVGASPTHRSQASS